MKLELSNISLISNCLPVAVISSAPRSWQFEKLGKIAAQTRNKETLVGESWLEFRLLKRSTGRGRKKYSNLFFAMILKFIAIKMNDFREGCNIEFPLKG